MSTNGEGKLCPTKPSESFIEGNWSDTIIQVSTPSTISNLVERHYVVRLDIQPGDETDNFLVAYAFLGQTTLTMKLLQRQGTSVFDLLPTLTNRLSPEPTMTKTRRRNVPVSNSDPLVPTQNNPGQPMTQDPECDDPHTSLPPE